MFRANQVLSFRVYCSFRLFHQSRSLFVYFDLPRTSDWCLPLVKCWQIKTWILMREREMNYQGSYYSLKTLKSPWIEKPFLRALEKPLKITKLLKILENSLNFYILFGDLYFQRSERLDNVIYNYINRWEIILQRYKTIAMHLNALKCIQTIFSLSRVFPWRVTNVVLEKYLIFGIKF